MGEITGLYTEQMTFTEEFRDSEAVTDRVITQKALSFSGTGSYTIPTVTQREISGTASRKLL